MKLGAEYYARVLGYWRGLGARERLVLGVGGGLAAMLLFLVLVWFPLQHDLDRLRAEVPTAQQKLQWMRDQAHRVDQLRANSRSPVPGGALPSFVEQSARKHGIRALIKPEGANTVHLTLDGVAFNNLLEWLANLQTQGGARIENANLEPTSTPGAVNARVLLRTGAS